jgi:hypothetical protein
LRHVLLSGLQGGCCMFCFLLLEACLAVGAASSLFSVSRKIKNRYEITLLYVCVSPPMLLGNGSANISSRKRIHAQQQQDSSTQCFLCGACRTYFSVYCARKAGDYIDFVPLVTNVCSITLLLA